MPALLEMYRMRGIQCSLNFSFCSFQLQQGLVPSVSRGDRSRAWRVHHICLRVLLSADQSHCPWGTQLRSKYKAGFQSPHQLKFQGILQHVNKVLRTPKRSFPLVLCARCTAVMCGCRKVNLENSRRVGVNLHSTLSCNTAFFYKLSADAGRQLHCH